MYNRKVLIDALKKLGSAKAPSVQKDNEYFPYQGESYFSMAKGGEAPYKKVSVQKSNVQGKGLFADEPIGAGEIIGLSHTKFMFKKNGEDYIKSQETPIIGKYYNHSDDAFNVESIVNGDKRYLRAIRDINPGEEILGNYYEDDDPTLESPDDFKKEDSANKKRLGGLIKSGKNALRSANVATLGTANTLAKSLIPVMINPARLPLLGSSIEKLGPFTGSPLNALPGYGETMPSLPDTAFRKFGDTLDYVKIFGELNPAHGPLLRMGKDQIISEGNWAELNEPNEKYQGVFGARFDFNTPGTNLGYTKMRDRNGVLITDSQGNRLSSIPISDPGLSFHRRLPFSNRYINVDMDKLRNNEFDWRTIGGNTQSLLERYGYIAGYAALLSAMGLAAPQEYLDYYINEPIMRGYNNYIIPGAESEYDFLKPKQYGETEYGTLEGYAKGGSAPKLPKKKNSKGYSRSLEATNRLFAEHPLFAKPKSRKKKIYDPKSKYYRNGGDVSPVQIVPTYIPGVSPQSPEEWDQQIKAAETQIGGPTQWLPEDYNYMQNMLQDYYVWRQQNPDAAPADKTNNAMSNYMVPIPYHLRGIVEQKEFPEIPIKKEAEVADVLTGTETLCVDEGRCLETDQIQEMLDRGRYLPQEVVDTAWDVIYDVYPEEGKGISAATAWKNRGIPTLESRLGMPNPANCMWAAGSGWMCEPEFSDVSKTAFESNDKFINAVNKGTVPFERVTKTTDPDFDAQEKGLLQTGDIINIKGPGTSHAMTFSHYREDGKPIYVDSNGRASDFDWNAGIWSGMKPGNGRTAYVSRFSPEMEYGAKIKELEEKARTNPTPIEIELTQNEIDQYVKGGYIVEDISIPSLTKAKKGGLVKARKGLPVTAGIKLLNLPGVKPIIRSNYNILSYPIKYMGARIGRQSSLKERDWNHIKSSFNPIKYDAKYFGQLATSLPPEYGYGKRDLLANYFFGDDRGFTPIEYDLDSDLGLKEVIKPYGDVSAYLMNSAYKHGEPISIYNFTGFARPQVPFKLENQPTTFDLDDGHYILGTHDKNFDKWKESFLEENPDFEKMKRAEYEENVLKSLDQHPSTLGLPVDFETTLLPSSALGREYYKHNLNKIFDDYQTDRLQFDISPDYKAKENKNLLYFDINPINTKDNVGGHMGFLTRKPNNEYEWTSRDLWSFRPGDYDLKWEMKNPWKKLQVELMDSFGKPFILHQTNPIKFKKGGLIKAWNGLTVPAKAIGTGLKTLGKQGYSAMFSDLRPILYKSINPASYAVADKLKSLPKEIYKNTVYNDTRPFRVGESMLLGLDRNLNTLLNRHELTKDQYFALSDPERAKLYKPLELEDIVNKGKRRLDAWAVGLKLPQEYSTLEQVGDDTYRMKNLNYTPDFFSERYTDLLANRLNKSNILYSGEDPLITLSRNHYDLTKHPFLQIGNARDPMQQEIIEKWSSLRRSQIDDYLGYKNDFQPWTQKRAVGLSTINPDKSFTDSIWDNDTQGVMGGFRWDIAETPEGIHWQANDRWDINPFEKRSSAYLNPDEQTLSALNSSYFAPLKGFEALSAVGGKPFSIKNNFLVEPKTFKILKEWEDGGETDYELGDEVDEATMQELKRLGYTFEKI